MPNDVSYKGLLPTSSDAGYPNNPDTSADYTFEDILDKMNGQVVGLANRTFHDLTSVGGTGNVVTASTIFATTRAPGITTLSAGMRFRYVPVATNTGAVTMQIDGMAAAVNVKANDGSAIASGYFQIGSSYDLVYDGTNLVVCDVGSSFLSGNRGPDDVFECQRTAGTADGNSTGGGTADDRLLNTEVRQRLADLNTSTGVFTLPPGGPYHIEAWVPMYGSGVGRAELYNSTDASVTETGTVVSGGTTAQVYSYISAYVTLASAKSYKIRSVHSGAGVTDGLGKPANITSQLERYSRVHITLIDETNETFDGTPGGPLTERYEFDDATSGGGPGAGQLAFNNASIAAATLLLIHKSNADGDDIAAHLAYLASGSSSDKAVFRIASQDDDTLFAVVRCTSFIDRTTHYEIAIDKLDAVGAVDAFTAGDALFVKMERIGDAGTSGAWTSITTPAQITADQNDYDQGAAGRQVLRISSDAARTITGLIKKATGELLNLENIGSFAITLDDDNSASGAENRFAFGRDVVIQAGESVTLRYSETVSRWKIWANSYQTSDFDAAEQAVASASTTNIGTVATARVEITGTTGITSFGTTVNKLRFVRFSGALTITYNASSMITLTGQNRVVQAGDKAVWASDASGNWRELDFTQANILPGRNYVDNPSFNNWQRGTSFALASSTRTVVADRWKAYRGATGSTFSRQTGFSVTGGVAAPKYCIRVARDSGNAATNNIRLWHQLHEFVARGLAGQYVTLSFDVRAGANYSGGALDIRIARGTGGGEAADLSSVTSPFATGNSVTAVSNTITPTTTAQRITCTPLLLGATVADLAFVIVWTPTGTAGAADYIEITNVKLEVGAVATQFVPPDAVADLLACQYTYQKTPETLLMRVTGATDGQVYHTLVPAMRAAPTLSLLNTILASYGTGATSTANPASIGSSSTSTTYIRTTVSGFSGMTLNAVGLIYTPDGGALGIDAELLS